MLLVVHGKIVTRIPRFEVEQEDQEKFVLKIKDVTKADKGAYACQVNTDPQLREIGYLNVVVSPEILDHGTSESSVIVKENGNVTLTCNAEGNPTPRISWIREDHSPITLTHRKRVQKYEGISLELRKVSRTDMGAYLCIASNGVPPTVSKRTVLYVQFSPIVVVPNQLMSAPRETSIRLECVTEAYPRAVTYWKYREAIVMTNNKYRLEEIHDGYKTKVFLTIHKLKEEDFGIYTCNSRNSFGENGGSVELHELSIPVTEGRSNRKDSTGSDMASNKYDKNTGYQKSHVHSQVYAEWMGERERVPNSSWTKEIYLGKTTNTRNGKDYEDTPSRNMFEIFSSSSPLSKWENLFLMSFILNMALR